MVNLLLFFFLRDVRCQLNELCKFFNHLIHMKIYGEDSCQLGVSFPREPNFHAVVLLVWTLEIHHRLQLQWLVFVDIDDSMVDFDQSTANCLNNHQQSKFGNMIRSSHSTWKCSKKRSEKMLQQNCLKK